MFVELLERRLVDPVYGLIKGALQLQILLFGRVSGNVQRRNLMRNQAEPPSKPGRGELASFWFFGKNWKSLSKFLKKRISSVSDLITKVRNADFQA
jgi:hypothetical protein